MEHYLFYMKALGLVEPEEERHQWVFHIMVSGLYSDWRLTQTIIPVRADQDNRKNRRRRWRSAAGRNRQRVLSFRASRPSILVR